MSCVAARDNGLLLPGAGGWNTLAVEPRSVVRSAGMLNLLQPRPGRAKCNGFRRREFLQVGALGLALLILGHGAIGQAAPPSAGTLTVAVVSPRCVFGDVEANLKHFTTFVEEANAKGARLVCFPELALTAWSTDPAVLKSAEEIPGPITKKLEALARRLDV